MQGSDSFCRAAANPVSSEAPPALAARYLALFLPWLPAERAVGAGLVPAGAPLVLVRPDDRGRDGASARITGLSCAAARLGLEVGMTIGEVGAGLAQLVTLPADPGADLAFFDAVVARAGGLGDLPEDLTRRWGMVLDVTGFAHAGDEQRLAAVRGLGLTVSGASAVTPDAAWALARFGCEFVHGLPLAALGLDDDARIALRRAGMRRIGDLAQVPRAALAERFGPDMVDRLGRLLGNRREATPPPP